MSIEFNDPNTERDNIITLLRQFARIYYKHFDFDEEWVGGSKIEIVGHGLKEKEREHITDEDKK